MGEMNSKHELWQQAAAFAARAHQHQVRKDRKTPYVSHPFRVAMTLRHVFDCVDNEVLAAALLHDTIEDCDTDYDDVLEQFGSRVADLVAVMTKDMRLVEPDREPAYDTQLAQGPWEGRLIKLADVYDNLTDAGDSGAPLHKMLDKAHRAIALASDDAELEKARLVVQDLVERAMRET